MSTASSFDLALRAIEAGDWNAAHEAIQHESSGLGAYLHGILHRREGDFSNARYWFARSGVQLSIDADGITRRAAADKDVSEEEAQEIRELQALASGPDLPA